MKTKGYIIKWDYWYVESFHEGAVSFTDDILKARLYSYSEAITELWERRLKATLIKVVEL